MLAHQTLIDVLRYRARNDAERIHLHITEDSEGSDKTSTLTFGELYAAGQRCACAPDYAADVSDHAKGRGGGGGCVAAAPE